MNPPSNPPPPWLVPLLCVAFPVFFVAVWSLVCLLLSAMGGWGRLAQRFPGSLTPRGTRFSGQRGRIGVTNYKGVLTIHTAPEGLHLAVIKIFRIGHPPILIPWAEIHLATLRRFLSSESVVFEVGAPRVAKVQLPKQVFAGTPVMIDGQPASSATPPRP